MVLVFLKLNLKKPSSLKSNFPVKEGGKIIESSCFRLLTFTLSGYI